MTSAAIFGADLPIVVFWVAGFLDDAVDSLPELGAAALWLPVGGRNGVAEDSEKKLAHVGKHFASCYREVSCFQRQRDNSSK